MSNCGHLFEDSELEMAYIDGYSGEEQKDYVASSDPRHLHGLRSVVQLAVFVTAAQCNREYAELIAAVNAFFNVDVWCKGDAVADMALLDTAETRIKAALSAVEGTSL